MNPNELKELQSFMQQTDIVVDSGAAESSGKSQWEIHIAQQYPVVEADKVTKPEKKKRPRKSHSQTVDSPPMEEKPNQTETADCGAGAALPPSNDDENVIDDFLLNITPAETKPQKLEFDIVDEEQPSFTPEEQQNIDLVVEEELDANLVW